MLSETNEETTQTLLKQQEQLKEEFEKLRSILANSRKE